jgi:hypothetical protein
MPCRPRSPCNAAAGRINDVLPYSGGRAREEWTGLPSTTTVIPRSQFGEDSFVEVYDFADRIDRY